VVKARPVWSIKDARDRLERILGDAQAGTDWLAFEHYLRELVVPAEDTKTAIASSLGATLELAREGRLELMQEAPFAPIYMRPRRSEAEWQRVL
jgi:segregation and condensation protein A